MQLPGGAGTRPWRNARPALIAGLLAATFVCAAGAIELDVDAVKMQAALNIARGPEPARAAFHRPYLLAASDPIVENIEIITEYRRLVKIAETQIANGNLFFTQNLLTARDAIGPFRQRLSVVAHLRFHPQNAYVTGPQVDVVLLDQLVPLPRLDLQTATQYALDAGPGQRVPVTGAVAEAVYDAKVVGQDYRTIVVRIDGKDVARVTIDFGRLE